MTKVTVHSKALGATTNVSRIIGHRKGDAKGPTLIFMAGIHGNEPAGIFALQHVFKALESKIICGNVYGIAGNLWALKNGERYQEADLNRLWTREDMKKLSSQTDDAIHQDQKEQIEINQLISKILSEEDGPFYFFDMHTTSSETLPFLTVNDSLLNRHFTTKYPIPIILGIEEFLDGPILSYINELGYVAFGFEAGQHDDMASIENCVAFIYLSLIFCECISKKDCEYQHHYNLLAKTAGDVRNMFEIYFHYTIKENENFKMLPGFYNFQIIKKNQHIANSNGKRIVAKHNGRIFMPLYQSKGSDGFFAIKKVWKPFLKLSEFLRKNHFDRILPLLPGIKWIDQQKSGLIVNKHVARFMAKDLFHLFGYRSVVVGEYHFKMFNREAAAKSIDYQKERWMNAR